MHCYVVYDVDQIQVYMVMGGFVSRQNGGIIIDMH